MRLSPFLKFAIVAGFVAAGPALAAPVAHGHAATLSAIAREVSAPRMKATVERLVAFGTRHTLSSQTDPKRGIGAALTWSAGEFRALGLDVRTPTDMAGGKRIPVPVRITDVIAVQRGTERPNDVVIISGHLDSRVSDVMNATADAPGANDDGSGTSATIEAARVLSHRKFPGTIVYAVLMGEEQGLFGGKLLADYARSQGWNVIATLNNDIIGNSCGSDGVCDAAHVRVFSEGPRWQGHEALAADIRSLGGENDSPSRNISRYLATLAQQVPAVGLDVRQVWRNDRFGRGGDHSPMLEAGFPAVRLTVAVENYNQQHQDLRVEKGVTYGDTVAAMDFPYLAKVTRLNTVALAALASAPPPPKPTVEGAVSTDTTVTFTPVSGADHYALRWRRTDAAAWQDQKSLRSAGSVVLPHIRVDDWVFGVSSVSADGWESPVASAVPGGAFGPYAAAPPAK